MTAPLSLDEMRKRASGGTVPGAAPAVKPLASPYASPTDPNYGSPDAPPSTIGAPAPRVGSFDDKQMADGASGKPVGSQPVGASPFASPTDTSPWTTNGAPISATPPPNYQGPMSSAPPEASAPPPNPAGTAQSASTPRMVQFGNGVTGAAGSSAGADAVGTRRVDPTTGYSLTGGEATLRDQNGNPIDAVYNGAGYMRPDGTVIKFNPQYDAPQSLSYGTDAKGGTATWGDVGAADNRVFTAHTTGTNVDIPGGKTDTLNTFEDLLGIDKVRANPNATLESLGVTEQQLIDAGLGHMVADGSWKTRTAGEESPFNIQLDPNARAHAREDGYYDEYGAYHPANESASYNLANGIFLEESGRPYASTDENPEGLNPERYAAMHGTSGATAPSTAARPGGSTGTAPTQPRPLPGGGVPSVGGGWETGPAGPGGTIPDGMSASGPGLSQTTSQAQPSLTSIDPNNDLRSKQINPSGPAPTDYASVAPGPSAATSQYSQLQSDAANAVGKGANRGDIAKGYLDSFDAQQNPLVRDKMRAAIERAAAVGRIGAGDTAVEAMNPMMDYLNNRAALEKELASDSASGDISDRLNNLSALNSTQGQSFGQDTTNQNAERLERDFTHGVNREGVADAANARDELRTERGFQYGSSRDAINDAVQQYLLEQQGEQQDFNRGNTLAGVGYANSPSNLLFGAGQSYGSAASGDYQALAQYLSQLLGR